MSENELKEPAIFTRLGDYTFFFPAFAFTTGKNKEGDSLFTENKAL